MKRLLPSNPIESTTPPSARLGRPGQRRRRRRAVLSAVSLAFALLATCLASPPAYAQEEGGEGPGGGMRGSIVEDRAARKLLEAGDQRYDSDEFSKAVEVWQSVIERYPRSRTRFDAHMRLGNYYLQRDRAYDRARTHFNAVSSEDNRDEDQRAEATLKMGICFYEARNFGMCFKVMREVVEKFPVSGHVNEAYYYIGLGHFQLKHYSRAIDALQKVGTAFSGESGKIEKVEPGKRLFVKIEDADLAALEPGQTIKVRCRTTLGDEEEIVCYPIGRNVRVILGSIVTSLGKPLAGNGILELRGDDVLTVQYVDAHTADRTFDRPVVREVEVVGNAVVAVTDGAFQETLQGIVLDREFNVQITDADQDLSDEADEIRAVAAVYREKSAEEIEAETAAAAAKAIAEGGDLDVQPEVDRYREIDRVEFVLREADLIPESMRGLIPGSGLDESLDDDTPALGGTSSNDAAAGNAAPESAGDSDNPDNPGAPDDANQPVQRSAADRGVHSGIFRAKLLLAHAETPIDDDEILQGRPGDVVRITYVDERHRGEGPRTLTTQVKCVEGNLGAVRVTRTEISDQELLIRTKLKTASALTNIGNRYKEFGLQRNAQSKYEEALAVCEEISEQARQLGGRLLEETYVQLWRIYFEMDRLELAAAMATRLQREFPNSAYIDDALLQLADVARKQREFSRAIGIYQRLVQMPTSLLRGEAQFGIASCYEDMAQATTGPASAQLFDRAFQEYKKVFDQFPDSGRVGEAVSRMANYYYQQKDYARAIDTFEAVLNNHPDAQYLDVILFNYGRCLYRMDRLGEARQHFDQLIADFPESPLAADAKKISEALAGRLGSGTGSD